MRVTRCLSILAAILSFSDVLATGTIRLSAYPTIAVADGRSAVTITAEVRNSGGSKVPDGTIVRFATDLGTFREADVMTVAGSARAVLIAPDIAGVAKVTASAASISTVNTVDVEFVKDRSVLASAYRYIDIESPEYLVYHGGIQIISASGLTTPARLRFGDIRIEAKDMQVDLPMLRVLAFDAILRIDDKVVECKRLSYSLARRRGTAIAAVDGKTAYYSLTAAEPTLSETGMMPDEFEPADVGIASSSIHAERVVAFPNREIQFHHAKVYVGDAKVVSMPLYAMRPSSDDNVLGDQILSYNNGWVVMNYPYYLKLSPSHTSVFRLRSGQDYGRGSSGSRGIFLDWENNYMIGESAEGAVTLGGIGRKDMGLSWRHTHRFDDRTSANVMLDFPSFRSVYGSVNASRAFDGFSINLNGSSSRSFRGTSSSTERLDLSVDSDMTRLGNLPITYSFGLTANRYRARIGEVETSQQGVGLRNRWVFLPIQLWDGANLMSSVTFSQLWDRANRSRFGAIGTVSLTTPFAAGTSMRLSYDYANDAFTSALTGKHRLSGQFFMNHDQFSLSLFGAKSLDLDSTTLYLDGDWKVSKLWRLGASFTYDRYLGRSVLDETLLLGYTFGTREIALTFNIRTGKFGLELLNVPIR